MFLRKKGGSGQLRGLPTFISGCQALSPGGPIPELCPFAPTCLSSQELPGG